MSTRAASGDRRADHITEAFDSGAMSVELFGEDFDWSRFSASVERELVFLDIETCGLGDTLIFLVGILRYRPGEPLRFESVFAADPSREPELVDRVAARLGEVDRWVSFNGACFDLPRLRKRALRHGVAFPEFRTHVDLLHEVRRRWKRDLPNCRLSTVERRLLGLERGPFDVPGSEVPGRYWDWVTTGRSELIEPIREHNRRDVLAMIALLHRLAGEGLLIE